MNLLTFNFCGVDAIEDLDLIVNAIRIPITPEISETTQDVPGMLGKLFLGNSYGQKIFEIDVTIKAKDATEQAQKIQRLTDLVMTFGSGEYPMIFSNMSEYTFYGHWTSVSTPQKVIQSASTVKTTMTFACSDPKGYGEYQSFDLSSNPATIVADGTSETYPIFTCIPKKDVRKIAISDEDGRYVFIGADVDPDTGDTPVDLEPRVVHDEANTLAYWTAVTSPTFPVENGVVRGTLSSYPNTIRPSDFGANYGTGDGAKWHGPLSLRWLPGEYPDYRIRVRLMNRQFYPRAQGKIELYFLNTAGERIGKFMLKDNGTESKLVYAQVQIGVGNSKHKDLYYGPGKIKSGKTTTKTIKVKNGTKTVTEKGKKKTTQLWKTVKLEEDGDTGEFTNFYGYMELQKIGNKYRVEILKQTYDGNPGWSKPLVVNWTDSKNEYTEALAGLALYCAKFDITEDVVDPRVNYKNNELALCDIEVWSIINGGNQANKPEVIARAGDEVKINCEDHRVYKNGAYFMKKFYIGSEFLDIKGGISKTFAFEPDLSEADWYIEYRPTSN